MKTPEEIKKGLALCSNGNMRECMQCPYPIGFECFEQPMKDAIAYIKRLEAGIDHAEKVARECAKSITEDLDKLESRLAQVERERDAAVADLKKATTEGNVCTACKNNIGLDAACEMADFDCNICQMPCKCKNCKLNCNYEWRGVCDDDTEDKE